MKIYIICPFSNCTEEYTAHMKKYSDELKLNNVVFFPPEDVNQNTEIQFIVNTEIEFIKSCDEVHIFWDRNSKGSLFDLGVAVAFGKKLVLVESLHEDIPGKSYEKYIKSVIKTQ